MDSERFYPKNSLDLSNFDSYKLTGDPVRNKNTIFRPEEEEYYCSGENVKQKE